MVNTDNITNQVNVYKESFINKKTGWVTSLALKHIKALKHKVHIKSMERINSSKKNSKAF